MKVIEAMSIDRDQTVRQMIDALLDRTDWNKYEAIMIELDEPFFRVQIIVQPKTEGYA